MPFFVGFVMICLFIIFFSVLALYQMFRESEKRHQRKIRKLDRAEFALNCRIYAYDCTFAHTVNDVVNLQETFAGYCKLAESKGYIYYPCYTVIFKKGKLFEIDEHIAKNLPHIKKELYENFRTLAIHTLTKGLEDDLL